MFLWLAESSDPFGFCQQQSSTALSLMTSLAKGAFYRPSLTRLYKSRVLVFRQHVQHSTTICTCLEKIPDDCASRKTLALRKTCSARAAPTFPGAAWASSFLMTWPSEVQFVMRRRVRQFIHLWGSQSHPIVLGHLEYGYIFKTYLSFFHKSLLSESGAAATKSWLSKSPLLRVMISCLAAKLDHW